MRLFRNALRQEYNMSITGGSNKMTYYASLGYLKNEGVVYNSDFERYTARVKADYQAKDWLKVGANVNFAHTDQNDVSDGSQTASVSPPALHLSIRFICVMAKATS